MYLLEFELASIEDTASHQMWHIETAIDTWFEALRDWLEVITHQDLSISEPIEGTTSEGNYLWSWRSEKGWTNALASVAQMKVTMSDLSAAGSLPTWNLAIQRANQGERPSESHLILRDARARLRREHFKYSAIFSGIAAEIAIKNEIERVLRKMGAPDKFVQQMIRATLGTLQVTSGSLGIHLPANMRQNLIEVRNRAAHRNSVVTQTDAKSALETATLIIRQIESL